MPKLFIVSQRVPSPGIKEVLASRYLPIFRLDAVVLGVRTMPAETITGGTLMTIAEMLRKIQQAYLELEEPVTVERLESLAETIWNSDGLLRLIEPVGTTDTIPCQTPAAVRRENS